MSNPLLALAVMPGVLLMMYFYKKDRHEPEPTELVMKIMGWGALSILPAILLELILDPTLLKVSGLPQKSMLWLAIRAFLVIGLSEELCKYWVVKKKIYDDPELDEPYDGIVYCVAASLGFAIAENILYVASGGYGVGIMRAFLSLPAHAFFAVFMGYFIGLSKFTDHPEDQRRYRIIAVAVATLAHGLYDFVLFTQVPLIVLTVFPMMGIFWALALWKIRKSVAASPHAFKPQPTLDSQDMANAEPVVLLD